MIDDSASRRKDGWTAEQDKTILTMRDEQFPWKFIAERTGRTVESCCARYRAIVPKDSRKRFRTSKRWSDDEVETLKLLLAERKSVNQIVELMNKPRKVVSAKIDYMRKPTRTIFTDLSARVTVPPARLADRDRRMAAELDLTAAFFGDPKPGQSALDKKQGVYA